MSLKETQQQTRQIINNPHLNYRQRMYYLAAQAESLLEPPPVSESVKQAMEQQVICDMREGAAPYRPRYLLPDYPKAIQQGSKYLELEAPQNLAEALNFLMILYTHTPSITGYPVYLGDLDKVLEPFAENVSDEDLSRQLRLFWQMIDRVLPDAFVHTNLGPEESRIGRIIFQLERQLNQAVPNITLKVDPDITPDSFLEEAVKTVFAVAKPHFVNHPMMYADLGENYGVVSCYNSLKAGGGSHTLVRLNLKEAVKQHQGNSSSFLNETLEKYVRLTLELMEARIRYLVEESRFFEHNFLAQEGLVSLDRFSAMFGIYGLAEAVKLLMEAQGSSAKYGHDAEANQLSYQITDRIAALLKESPLPYCEGNGGFAFLHSQSGIDLDLNVTAGTRIPIGEEPELYEHIFAVAPHHHKFSSGVSDIFHFDDTVKRNPQAVVDVIKGGLAQGMRDFTFNIASNDFIRITGYLVRKSDIAQLEKESSRYNSTVLGAGSEKNQGMTKRNLKRVMSHEQTPRLS